MKRYLFAFGYESPADARANVTGGDAESSNAVWISAASEEAAIEDGRRFAEEFVAAQFKKRPKRGHAVPFTFPAERGDPANWH